LEKPHRISVELKLDDWGRVRKVVEQLRKESENYSICCKNARMKIDVAFRDKLHKEKFMKFLKWFFLNF